MQKCVIFIIGSIFSGIGKGVFSASLGKMLEQNDYKVLLKKIDGYLNVDAGTINPIEHGEVFVTKNGYETDMDLGTYERFMSYETKADHIITIGKVFFNLLSEEREGDKLLGKTIEYYHLENKIKDYIYANSENYDIILCEIGGVIGDNSNTIILRAISKIEKKIVINMSYAFLLQNVQEYKTRPSIIALQTLWQDYAIKADLIAMRSEKEIPKDCRTHIQKKIASNFEQLSDESSFLFIPDFESSYLIYGRLFEEQSEGFLEKLFGLIEKRFPSIYKPRALKEKFLKSVEFMNKIGFYSAALTKPQKVKILLLGKYNKLLDSYSSVCHAMAHASAFLQKEVELVSLAAETFPIERIKEFDGILVPGGFGYGRTDFLQEAIKIARENNIPFLGICFGMQLACLEGLKNLCGIKATSSEFFSENEDLKKDHVAAIDLVENCRKQAYKSERISGTIGGSMRLGIYHCKLKENSQASQIYGTNHIEERHRHRYEVNTDICSVLEEKGYVFSGVCDENGLIEILEYPKNDLFIAVQFHPEFNSLPQNPNPLFISLVEKSVEYCKKKNS